MYMYMYIYYKNIHIFNTHRLDLYGPVQNAASHRYTHICT